VEVALCNACKCMAFDELPRANKSPVTEMALMEELSQWEGDARATGRTCRRLNFGTV
jgi:hypothetical protein